jgi:beta-glucosidase
MDIDMLIDEMTLEEKVSMLAGIDFWHTRAIERLGIPSIKMTDGPHGVRTMSDVEPDVTLEANCYPTGSALGATWNAELINRVGTAIGKETRAKGCAIILGPCINIHHSPLGGRNFESYSEDPYLTARMTVAFVKGVQSQHTGVSVKHYALNNQEHERLTISSEADERTIREIYLPAFRAVVEECDPWTVMCSYNKINGTYASENRYFLTDILKKEWGFRGVVISDWGAVHSVIPAARAGLDLEMPGPARFFGEALVEASRKGEVGEDIIDDKVRRILGVIERSGAFDEPVELSGDTSDTSENRQLAREAAGEAIVLLKNAGNILPLDKTKLKSIAIIGPNADEARIQGGGSSQVNPYYTVTPLQAVREKYGEDVSVAYQIGCRNNRLTLPIKLDYLLQSGESHQAGLTGEYFNNRDMSGTPVLTRSEKTFTLRLGGVMGRKTPGVAMDGGDYAIRMTGKFVSPDSGIFTFGLLTDGLGCLYIDEKLVVDKSREEPDADAMSVRREYTGQCPMEAGRSYDIRVEFVARPGFPDWMPRYFRLGCTPPLPADAIERAVRAAASSDIALVFVGLNDEHEAEGRDRESMELPGAQVELIKKVAQANPNTIVVLNNGSPVEMNDWLDDVAGVVEAWFTGQECGHAIADILFGDVNPSGKLPVSFPARYEDNPTYDHYPGHDGQVHYAEGIFVGYRHYDSRNVEPLFPFGFGLSYTRFEYGNLKVPAVIPHGENIGVQVDVTNIGNRAGKEVVQLYVRDVTACLPRPKKELKGFKKVHLEPGETKTVNFEIGIEALSFYDVESRDWVAEPGEFEILIGGSSRDIRCRAAFTLDEAID